MGGSLTAGGVALLPVVPDKGKATLLFRKLRGLLGVVCWALYEKVGGSFQPGSKVAETCIINASDLLNSYAER